MLAEFIRNATFPVISCNLDTSQEPELDGLVQVGHVFFFFSFLNQRNAPCLRISPGISRAAAPCSGKGSAAGRWPPACRPGLSLPTPACLQPYTILELPRSGVKVGVVGLTTVDTPETSSPGPNVRLPAIQ